MAAGAEHAISRPVFLTPHEASIFAPGVRQSPPGYWPTPPARLKKAGKTAEEYEKAIAAYYVACRAHIAHNAAIRRKRSVAAGVISYRWIAAIPDACAVARRNNGKVFGYDKPPPEGHIGEGWCGAVDWCRCVPKPIVPGLDD